MQFAKNIEFKKVLVITPERLIALAKVLPNQLDIEYQVSCIDGSILRTSNLNEVLELPNPPSSAIKGIVIASGYGMPVSFRIALRNEKYSPSSYSIEGEYSVVASIINNIEQHVEAMQASSRVKSFISAVAVDAIIFALGLLAIFWFFVAIHDRYHLNLAYMALIFGFLAVCWGIKGDKLREYLFPAATFCLGDGLSRHNRLCSIKHQLTWGLALAIAAGLLANLIYYHF